MLTAWVTIRFYIRISTKDGSYPCIRTKYDTYHKLQLNRGTGGPRTISIIVWSILGYRVGRYGTVSLRSTVAEDEGRRAAYLDKR